MIEEELKNIILFHSQKKIFEILEKTCKAYDLIPNLLSKKISNQTRYIFDTTQKSVFNVNGSPLSTFDDTLYKSKRYQSSTISVIFIILESPHNTEISKNIPAAGKTGIAIHQHISCLQTHISDFVFKKSINQQKYRICLINPIPYQASLGLNLNDMLYQEIRDKVWITLWNDKRLGLEKKFIKLLEKIPKNSIILNGCTGGKNGILKNTIRQCIEQINFINSNIYIGEISHPSAQSYRKSIENLPANLKEVK